MTWFERPPLVFVLYLALTVLMTWPVSLGLTRDLPSDLGDPAFVAGVLAWGSKHWLELFAGDLSAATRFWTAPWFYPEPLTLAFSEHFALHSLLTLPVYIVTQNIILCYNLLFLATFALSGFGMYLFVREATGRPLAAFVAGIAFAFAPYRFGSLSHLQVLSSHWMPFALYGFHRYFRSFKLEPLILGSLALWAQNMSSGYYMVFFGPFFAMYVLAEMLIARLFLNLKVWLHLITAGLATALLTMPFAIPYLVVRGQSGQARPLKELTAYSADLMGWLTASPVLKLWGTLQPFVKIEGYLFPGVTILVLAVLGLWCGWRAMRSHDQEHQGTRVIAMWGTVAIVLSFWMSLGPSIEMETQPTGCPAIYQLAYWYLPGYDVARVPARFAMITVLALATVAGLALAWIDRRHRWLLAICGVLLLAEGFAAPLPRNLTWTSAPDVLVPAENRMYPEPIAPPVYSFLRTLDNAVIAHLPFGAPEREIQYVYYAAQHRRRIVNGYSGAFPPAYLIRLTDMQNVVTDPRATTVRMVTDGVTHVVIHAGAWTGNKGQELVALFDRSNGYARIANFGTDYVYQIR